MNKELENENKKIDLAFEHIKPIDFEKVFEDLKNENKELIEALRYFTDRVESDTIRSKKTYAMFKALISKHDLKYENHLEDGDSLKTI